VRHRDAYASVQVMSPPGYSSWKSASTLITPSEAGEGRLPLPGLSGLGSDIREDLDLRCALHSGLLHPGPQARVAREAGCLLDGREVVRDEQVIAIIGKPHNALPGGDGALVANRGLLALPEPAGGDLFFDIEGARYYSEDGRESGLQYLFGVVDTAEADGAGLPRYTQIWAFDRAGEKRAFEELIDFITERRARHPGLHVYHYNHYEPTSVDHLTDASPEEAREVARLAEQLTGRTWRDKDGAERSMKPTDILIVTPYNAQIRAIQTALTASGQPGFRVGTVDKFQGQEAPVVIYSMATSSADEAPRGLDFLYDPHRLNVATSRARALAIIVASPDLIRVSCRTPQQIILANALCRAWETGG
jgi:AAA domain